MRTQGNTFRYIMTEIAHVAVRREALISDAFTTLEKRWPLLAEALLVETGSKRRAAYWLCAPNRSIAGKSPCDLLAEGDQDGVWELLEGNGEGSIPERPGGPRL